MGNQILPLIILYNIKKLECVLFSLLHFYDMYVISSSHEISNNDFKYVFTNIIKFSGASTCSADNK